MTQTELLGYMRDIKSEIDEGEHSNKIISHLGENVNGYGCHLDVIFEVSFMETIEMIEVKKEIIKGIVQRIESLFEMDVDLEFISGSCDTKITHKSRSFKALDITIPTKRSDKGQEKWNSFSLGLSNDPNVYGLTINIGKLQGRSKIKKFESFK